MKRSAGKGKFAAVLGGEKREGIKDLGGRK